MKKALFYHVAAGVCLLSIIASAAEDGEGWGTLILRDTQGATGDQKWKADAGLFEPRGNLDVKMQRVIMPLGYVLSPTDVEVKIGNKPGSTFPDYGYYLDTVGDTVNNQWSWYNPSLFNNVKNGTNGRLTTAIHNGVTVNFHHTEISTDGGSTWKKVSTTKAKGDVDADIFCCHATYTYSNFSDPNEKKEDYGWTFFDEDNRRIILSSNAVAQANVVLVSDFRVRLVYDYPVPSELWIADHADAGDGYVYLAVRPTLTPNVNLTSAIAVGLAPFFKVAWATSDTEFAGISPSDWQSVVLRDSKGALDVDQGLIWFKVSSALGAGENQRVCKIVFAPPY